VDEIICGDIKINKLSRTVCKNDVPIDMTAKEFDLLLLLAENQGKTLTKEFLFNRIWGSDSFSEQQTLTVHIKWLRQKIEDDPKKPRKIQTVWGVGYQYESV
jgi:DNA-binding response OmpR family regulator